MNVNAQEASSTTIITSSKIHWIYHLLMQLWFKLSLFLLGIKDIFFSLTVVFFLDFMKSIEL